MESSEEGQLDRSQDWIRILACKIKFANAGDHGGLLRCCLMETDFSQISDLKKLLGKVNELGGTGHCCRDNCACALPGSSIHNAPEYGVSKSIPNSSNEAAR
jgi:hypothetical protein